MHKLPDWIASIRQRRRKRGKRTLTDLPNLSDFVRKKSSPTRQPRFRTVSGGFSEISNSEDFFEDRRHIIENRRCLEDDIRSPCLSFQAIGAGQSENFFEKKFASAPPSARTAVRSLPVNLTPENVYASVSLMPRLGNRRFIRTNPWLPPPSSRSPNLDWQTLSPALRPLTPEKFRQALKNPGIDDLSSSGYSSHDSSPESSLHSPRWTLIPPFKPDHIEEQEKCLNFSVEQICAEEISVVQLSDTSDDKSERLDNQPKNVTNLPDYRISEETEQQYSDKTTGFGTGAEDSSPKRPPESEQPNFKVPRCRKPMIFAESGDTFQNDPVYDIPFPNFIPILPRKPSLDLELDRELKIHQENWRIQDKSGFNLSRRAVENSSEKPDFSSKVDKSISCQIEMDDLESLICEECGDCDLNGNPVRIIRDNEAAHLLLAELDRKLSRLRQRAQEISSSTQRAKAEYRQYAQNKQLLCQNFGVLKNLKWVIHGSEVFV